MQLRSQLRSTQDDGHRESGHDSERCQLRRKPQRHLSPGQGEARKPGGIIPIHYYIQKVDAGDLAYETQHPPFV